MFSLLSGFWEYIFSKPKLHVLMIGLDNAGKTTLLERIKAFYHLPAIPLDKIPPTIGMNLAKLHYKGHIIIIWDLGGQMKMRNLWEKYYDGAHCILYVVDSADSGRMDEAKLAFDAISDHELTTQTPIILCANKQDLPSALPASTLLAHLAPLDAHTTLPMSGVTGDGIERLMDAIVVEAKRGQRART